MAIAFDSTTGVAIGATNPQVWSHTCTGSNRILFVAVYKGVSGTISGVTYNGVAMTKIIPLTVVLQEVSLWYLIAPTTGSNTVSVTGSGTAQIGGCSSSYTGVNQYGQPDDFTTHIVSVTPTNTTLLTSDEDSCWFVIGAFDNFSGLSAGTGSTLRTNISSSTLGIYDSNSAKTPPGSYSMTINCSATTTGCGVIMASFSPVQGWSIALV